MVTSKALLCVCSRGRAGVHVGVLGAHARALCAYVTAWVCAYVWCTFALPSFVRPLDDSMHCSMLVSDLLQANDAYQHCLFTPRTSFNVTFLINHFQYVLPSHSCGCLPLANVIT
jgi:hypothetical protein